MKKKIIWTIFVVLWMGIIFWFSAKPAEESADMSRSTGQFLGRLIVKDYENWSPERQDAFAAKIDYGVRKSAHAAEYAFLGILLTGMYQAYGWKGKRWALLSLGTGVLYAASDEFHQLFVPGRSGQFSDVVLDSCGVLAGVLLAIGVKKLIDRWRK